jgi:outer membrane receptor protein involved in Fe transport
VCFVLSAPFATLAGPPVRVQGVVRNTGGAPVAGARVDLRTASSSASNATNSSGEFVFDSVPESSGTISVRAAGFAAAQRAWHAGADSTAHLEIVLALAPLEEQLIVTATRIETRLSEVAGGAVALDFEDLSATPALAVDDKLRQIPGFTLFRRSGSRTANPTSLGVSLSGLGASGASRALVLEDGVPLNDPFGGWIYWDRVPQQALRSVEVIRRGTSSLYGGDALGGAIQFLTRQPEGPAVSLETSYGSEQTPDLSVWAGSRLGRWDASLAAELFHTDGYILVPLAIRGPVDTPANSEDAAIDFTLGRRLGGHGRIFGRGSFFTEARHNGTPIQTNDTQIGQGVLGLDTPVGSSGSLSARVYGSAQSYDQNFSAIAANRMSESLTDQQHVPAQQLGGSVFWSQAAGRRQTLGLGAEAGEVIGSSHEGLFSSGAHTAIQIAGGHQRTLAVYGEDFFRFSSKWIATASFRFDDWRNFDALSFREPLSLPGPPTVTPFPDRSDSAFSPRLSLLYALRKNVSLSASAYRSFRSPTLNELYRSFRMGNVLTEANPDLGAERLTGAEAGASAAAFGGKLNLRGNFFWNDIVDPIENVTLSTTPSLITRQRQNLGRTRSRGVEVDAVARLSKTIEIWGGYQFVDATVVSFPAEIALQGLDIPEVPRNQLTVQARYWKPSGYLFSAQSRFVGRQFDDDRNQFLLPSYFTLDLLAARSLGHGVEAFAAFENLLDRRYTVALTPTRMLGPPLLARVGLRYNHGVCH